jgi:hypothetical protein
MDLLHRVAEGSNVFGLMVYSAGMILIVRNSWLRPLGKTVRCRNRSHARRDPRRRRQAVDVPATSLVLFSDFRRTGFYVGDASVNELKWVI